MDLMKLFFRFEILNILKMKNGFDEKNFDENDFDENNFDEKDFEI